jgi:hypothetical protein
MNETRDTTDQSAPVRCPRCSQVMNRHAEKPSEPWTEAEAMATELGLGLAVVTVHTCPSCGAIEARRTTPGSSFGA